jgi:hypothetical protein
MKNHLTNLELLALYRKLTFIARSLGVEAPRNGPKSFHNANAIQQVKVATLLRDMRLAVLAR